MSACSVKAIIVSITRISIAVVVITAPILYFYFEYGTQTVSPVVSTDAITYVDTFSSDYVNDEANLLGPFKRILDKTAKNWADTLGIEVQVRTLHLPGNNINELTNDLFKKMGVGNGYETGGILIVTNSATNDARIEVSGSLEGVFTDAVVGLLAHDQLAPYASYNSLGMAIMDVLHFLKDHALLNALSGNLEIPEKLKYSEEYLSKKRFYSTGGGAKVSLPDVPTDINFKISISKKDKHLYMPGKTPTESITAFKNSIRDYIGYPDLELFTEGGRVIRESYPFSPYEELARLERIEQSEPLTIKIEGDYAVAMSMTPAHGFVPILMHQVKGFWQIDLPETWKSLFYDGSGNYYLKNKTTPYYFALKELGDGREYNIYPLPVPEGQLQALIDKLKSNDDALSKFRLAEILFRNAFASIDAISYYEQAVKLAPKDPLFLETYADRAMYLGFSDLAIPLYQRLGKAKSIDLVSAYYQSEKLELADETLRAMLISNPYNLESLRWLKWLLKKQDNPEAKSIKKRYRNVKSDVDKPGKNITLSFRPKRPLFHSSGSINVNGTKVYGYSNFSITMKNPSNRDVIIDTVVMDSHGTGRSSGLGDVKNYWKYADSLKQQYLLKAGDRITVKNNDWGFTINPSHQRLSYYFTVCWHAVDSSDKQCSYQWLHLASDKNLLWTAKDFNEGGGLSGLWFLGNEPESYSIWNVEDNEGSITMFQVQKTLEDNLNSYESQTFVGVLSDNEVTGKLIKRNKSCHEYEEWRDIYFWLSGHKNRMIGVADATIPRGNDVGNCKSLKTFKYYYLDKL